MDPSLRPESSSSNMKDLLAPSHRDVVVSKLLQGHRNSFQIRWEQTMSWCSSLRMTLQTILHLVRVSQLEGEIYSHGGRSEAGGRPATTWETPSLAGCSQLSRDETWRPGENLHVGRHFWSVCHGGGWRGWLLCSTILQGEKLEA